jgi:hypothetical protein
MKNFIYDDGTERKHEDIDYTYSIVSHLKRLLPDFNDYLFIVYNHLGTTLPASRNFKHDKKILFWEAGQNRRQPFDAIKKDYRLIFSTHARTRENIYSMPLGYWDKRVIGKVIPMSERMYDVSFVGCLNRNRVHLASLLSGRSKEWIALGLMRNKKKTLDILNRIIQWRYTSDYFMFTEDFAAGVDRERYSYLLRNSKVVLCPRGFVSTECFRMFGGMMHECVVITEKLPEREYYEGIPVFQVDKWKKGWEIARYLIEHPERLPALGKESRKFYLEHFQPKTVAKWAAKIISERC